MLPSAATYIRGVKDTADVVSQEKPLEIGDKIWMHDPNRNKGLAWVLRNGENSSVTEHIFGHLEDAPFANWVEFAGADEVSQGATGLVFKTGHGVRMTTGSRIYFPRTGEILRLTAAMSTDTTGAVVRNFGRGVTTDYLLTGDKGLLITPGFEQGFTMGDGLSNSMVYKSFATTEISYPVQTTYVENAEKSRGGNPFKRALRKALKQSKDQMEAELFLGAIKIDNSTYAHPLTVSEGMDNYVTTNSYSATTLSRMDLWDILAEWTALNKVGGAIMCSMAFKSMVTGWAMDKVVYDQETKKDGLDITQVMTPFGVFDLIEIDLFNQEPTLMGTAFFVPKGHVDYHPLIHDENLDIRYYPISRDEIHSKEGEIYGVYGWEFYEEEMFAKLSGLQFAA